MTDLSRLKTVVTGGAAGIGLATTRALAAQGAAVAVLDLEPTGAPRSLLGLKADGSDTPWVARLLDGGMQGLRLRPASRS